MSDHQHIDPRPYWEKQNETLTGIKEKGMQAFVDGLSNIESAFELRDRTIRCIDEGTPGGIHIAGQGILMNADQIADFCAKAEPDGVMSHEECGACGIYAKREKLDAGDTDGYGKVWVAKLAEICAIPVKGHISVQAMARPSGLHIARVAYYDGTGSFDPAQVGELPQGFVISRARPRTRRTSVAVNIATGSHGFGGLVTPDAPFMLIAVAKAQDGVPLETLMAELRDVAAAYGGRAVVDGFVN